MLVERDDDFDCVKVLDFGMAKVPVAAFIASDGARKLPGQRVLTREGTIFGTCEYMAPEQALGQEADARADLYALGVVLYAMLVGTRPFDGDSNVGLFGLLMTAPVPRMIDVAPDAVVPPEVEAIVTTLLAKEASERYADARALLDAIDALAPPPIVPSAIATPQM